MDTWIGIQTQELPSPIATNGCNGTDCERLDLRWTQVGFLKEELTVLMR